jgi:hypothetical protein
MDDDFDNLLSDIGDDSESADTPKTEVKTAPVIDEGVSAKTPEPISGSQVVETTTPTTPMEVPKIVGDVPAEYNEIVKSLQFEYHCLPRLDYDAIYSELSDLAIKSSPSPTLQMINDEIQKIQSSKDRLDDIIKEVDRNYYFKKAAVDLLEKAYCKYSDEKSADKRKGDVSVKISNFVIDFAKTDSCFRVCFQILNNLNSSHESLSRRITVNQQLLKMNDYGRGQLPDYDFNSKRSNETMDQTGTTADPDSNPNEATEVTF